MNNNRIYVCVIWLLLQFVAFIVLVCSTYKKVEIE